MKNRKDILWGLLLIVVGIIWGINSLGIVKIDIFFDGWWTLFIIVPSLIDLFTDEDKTGSIIGIIIGVFLLLACHDIIDFSIILKLLFPIVLVIIGLSLLIKNPFKGNKMKKGKENLDEYAATFGVQNLDYDNEKFNGCSLNAVFGKVSCDLSKAKINDDVVVNVCSVFGATQVIVPDDVCVKVYSTPIFGGVTNKRGNKSDSKYTIYINCTCLFGGVEIK